MAFQKLDPKRILQLCLGHQEPLAVEIHIVSVGALHQPMDLPNDGMQLDFGAVR